MQALSILNPHYPSLHRNCPSLTPSYEFVQELSTTNHIIGGCTGIFIPHYQSLYWNCLSSTLIIRVCAAMSIFIPHCQSLCWNRPSLIPINRVCTGTVYLHPPLSEFILELSIFNPHYPKKSDFLSAITPKSSWH